MNEFSPTPYRGCCLYNVGATCYVNVVLQCLTHTVPFVNALINSRDCICRLCSNRESVTSSDDEEEEVQEEEEEVQEEEMGEEKMEEEQEKNNDETPTEIININKKTICWLCKVRDHIIMAIHLTGMCYLPKFFIRNLTDISSLFVEDEQQDAHEYLLGLLTRLHECCLGLPASSPNTSLEDESLITNIFCGRLKSQIRCRDCNFKSETFEPVLNLSLEIDGHNNLITALQSFTKVEKIDDPENLISCDGCKAKVVVEKQLTLDKAPEVLVIQLKRFTCDGLTIVKKAQPVQFPEILNLAPFIDEYREQELNYRLYAVVIHHGLSLNGHYVCYIHSHDFCWYLKNDSRELICNSKWVMNQMAYMLFYVKMTSSMSMSFHSFVEMLVKKQQQTNNSEEMSVPEQQQSNNNEESSSSTLQG